MSEQTFIIVGASLAGAKAAEELRERGLRRTRGADRLRARAAVRAATADQGLPARRVRRARRPTSTRTASTPSTRSSLMTEHDGAAIDPGASRVTLADGRELGYRPAAAGDRRGAAADHGPRRRARRRPLPAHARRLRPAARATRCAAATWWWSGRAGSAASSPPRLASAGLEVTMIDPVALPNERIFGPEIGAFYRDVHAQHGVELVLGEGVESFEGDGAVARVRTSRRPGRSSATSPSSASASCRASSLPRTPAWRSTTASSSTSSCRPRRRTCSPPATSRSAWHPFYGERIRVEHWANALNQGPAAARAMLGEPVSYDRIPYFFSDQYEVGMEYSGYAPQWDEVVFRGDRDERRVHRLLAARRARGRRDERQRLGCQRARPGADPLPPGRRPRTR